MSGHGSDVQIIVPSVNCSPVHYYTALVPDSVIYCSGYMIRHIMYTHVETSNKKCMPPCFHVANPFVKTSPWLHLNNRSILHSLPYRAIHSTKIDCYWIFFGLQEAARLTGAINTRTSQAAGGVRGRNRTAEVTRRRGVSLVLGGYRRHRQTDSCHRRRHRNLGTWILIWRVAAVPSAWLWATPVSTLMLKCSSSYQLVMAKYPPVGRRIFCHSRSCDGHNVNPLQSGPCILRPPTHADR